MSITIELPADIERNLRDAIGDLDAATKEAALVDLYRQGKLSQVDPTRAFGTDRLNTEAIPRAHHRVEDAPSRSRWNSASSTFSWTHIEADASC